MTAITSHMTSVHTNTPPEALGLNKPESKWFK